MCFAAMPANASASIFCKLSGKQNNDGETILTTAEELKYNCPFVSGD